MFVTDDFKDKEARVEHHCRMSARLELPPG